MLQVEELAAAWSPGQDAALVQLTNTLAARFHCKPELVSPGELYLTEAELASRELQPLQGLATEDLRSRQALLVALSGELQQQLLPLVDYRTADRPGSLAGRVRAGRNLLLYHSKAELLTSLLDSSHQRSPDQVVFSI